MCEKNFCELGLTTKEALNVLQKDIQQVLSQYEHSQQTRKSKSWLKDTFHHASQHTAITWISIFLIVVVIVILSIAYLCNSIHTIVLYQIAIIVITLCSCIFLELLDNKLRHSEIPRRVQAMVDAIKEARNTISWKTANYPDLLTPFSPCITLQWTLRDNELVNLPWALLVKDDIIVIRPGQISPGFCESIEKNAEYPLLHAKEVYGPSLQNANEFFSTPKSRKPLNNKKYRLLETPYLNNLRIALEQALDRPVTVQNQLRHFVMVKMIERVCLPLVLALMIIINVAKYVYVESLTSNEVWIDMFVITPIATIIPLLPLTFPIAWNCLNYLGIARFQCIFDITRKLQHKPDLFEDHDTLLNNSNFSYNYIDVWKNFKDILRGKETVMVRSANILHVLGSLTALCCVDKKGILSWPNPTAEKVFFLHNRDNSSQTSSLANVGELINDADSVHGGTADSFRNNSSTSVAEVLDITHDQNDPFTLHFDDTDWYKHLNSLKPLGLAILLNTCNMKTQENYNKFCSHITCEAMYNENLIPVTNRRCLCELAKEIGFSEEAQKVFTLEQQLSTYRHLQTEMVRRDNKYARTLYLSTKLKFPFPHMFAVAIKELSSGSIQLLSQGTADIILDSCIDYWDGHDLCPLTPSDRKKIQDFYQRSSLTAYCTAFAYRPLYKGINEKLSQMYLELPSDSRHLYLNHSNSIPVHCDCRSVLEPRLKTAVGQFYSTDSLLYNDSPSSDVSDIDGCFEIQCNQVFIGMVTMQYQAQLDMVHLIEQLERACIRFVHFSKENELRSRVFSEKMGLESGWNCHISLLSERGRRESGPSECWANNGTARVCSPADLPHRKPHSPTSNARLVCDVDSTLDSTKALSYSAPSAINLEHSVVKFETEIESLTKESCNQLQDTENQGTDVNSGLHDWQSLSCLTDSTEQSVPINFDMSNRAKLPRGIDKIRPHIENIDNVPLLVSLFTDCTASTTKEMIKIMQDYGEVICVIGSSANYETCGIFMQADASIAIEPLYPQVCQKADVFGTASEEFMSPIELSRLLNSIACSLSIKREDPLSIIYLIIEARHFTSLLWNTVQFWLCSCITLSVMQVLTAVLMLPALLTTGQSLWICIVIIPFISLSLMGTSVDPETVIKPEGKKQIGFNFEVFIFILWCYGAKFFPMALIVITLFASTLINYCTELCFSRNCTCKLFYMPVESYNSTSTTYIDNETSILCSVQQFCVILIMLHLMTISVSFVYRNQSIWTKSPFSNSLWLGSSILVLVLQTLFTFLSLQQNGYKFDIPSVILVFAFLSPLITFAINEIVKREEIKINLRYQRRAKLDFGTKLGMNSPF